MFPTRIRQLAGSLGTILLLLIFVGGPVALRLTDLGMGSDGVRLDFISDAVHHPPANTIFHIGGCKLFAGAAVCSYKNLSYDHAHGLRFTANLTTRPRTGL
jgi:hypothetical protein